MAVLLAAALAWALTNRSSGRWVQTVEYSQLQKERVMYEEALNIFLVKHGEKPLALGGWSPHSPGRDESVLFCRSSELFVSLEHGEAFDVRGIYFGGPAPRGLDQFEARVADGTVLVDPTRVIEGLPKGTVRPLKPSGPFCPEEASESEPGFLQER